MIPWRRRLDEAGRRRARAALAITDGEHVFTVLAYDGSHRIRGYPSDKLVTARNFRTSNVLSYNLYEDTAGRPWVQGYFEDGSIEDGLNYWGPAWWQMTATAFVFLFTIDEQTGRYGHRPRPIQVIDDGDGSFTVPDSDPAVTSCGLYVLAQASEDDESGNGLPGDLTLAGAVLLHWDGTAITLPDATTASDWPRRTATSDVVQLDGVNWGRGNTHSFHDGPDVQAYDLDTDTAFQTYPLEALAAASSAIGYGHYFFGFPMHLFFYSERWYAIMRGFVVDRADEPLNSESIDTYAACALFVCNSGEVPTNAAAWVRCLDVFAPFDVDDSFNDLGGSDKVQTNFYASGIEFGGKYFFFACSIMPLGDVGDDALVVDDTAIRVLDGDGLHKSLSFSETNAYGSMLVSNGSSLFWPEISVSEQSLYIWQHDLADDLDHWELAYSTPLAIDEEDEFYRGFSPAAYLANGRIYVLWGRRPSVLNDAPIPDTDGDGRLWQMATVRLATGGWTFLSPSMPLQDLYENNDNGLFPRFVPTLDNIPDTGGGGTPTGPCDEVFSAFGTPSISYAVFDDVFTANSSPLLGEHTSAYYYDLAVAAGVNPAFALGQWVKETVIGASPGETTGFNNVGLLRCHSWGTTTGCGFTSCCGYFATYSNWTNSVIDYLSLISGPTYAGLTISQIIAKYAPATDHNATQEYIDQLCDRMSEWAADSGL